MDEEKLYKCYRCEKFKTIDHFYSSKTSIKSYLCRVCTNNKEKERYREKKEKCFCGSPQVSPRLNTYKDEMQKKCTFQFLTSIGWIFDEENKIWWKEGFKNKDGQFVFIRTKEKKIRHRKSSIKDKIPDIIKFIKEGLTTKEIVKITGISSTTINKIKKNEKLSNRSNRNSN